MPAVGSFTLRSGQVSSEYFDKYLFEARPEILAVMAEQMAALLPPDSEVLGGLELGGIPLATVISSRTGLPVVFIRKHAKEYGTRRLAEGLDVSGRKVTLIEDVLTTGGAVRDATLALRGLGATITTVVAAIDRSGHDGGPLRDVGLETRAALTKDDLDTARSAASVPGAAF